MPNKMLIDATHPEETRVVVLRGNRVEEFDFESANRKQLRGNIYLAKVTRVEPSLQAAFVDYGGNRHGFLAFSEIHPDYYQIPVADRQALIDEEERAARAADAEADNRAGRRGRRDHSAHRSRDHVRSEPIESRAPHESGENGTAMAALSEEMAPAAGVAPEGEHAGAHDEETRAGEPHDSGFAEPAPAAAEHGAHESSAEPSAHAGDAPHADDHGHIAASDTAMPAADDAPAIHAAEHSEHAEGGEHSEHAAHADHGEGGETSDSGSAGDNITEINGAGGEGDEEVIESVGGADAMEEVPERNYRSRRQYKIQEVIKRRQVMLVQVVKEERGTKGAALTTYLSLAGRYSVLMPNTARGGGISRKITSAEDRRRLKEIAQDLEVPEGMGVILRTAGAARTKTEVKRDFEYLLRLWETVRDLTLKSTAPTLVYEEGSLVKRSIRDLYNKDIDEVLVAGEEAFKDAKEFMRMLMPSHAKNVKAYRDTLPVFTRFGIESQLDAMFQPVVQLRSGGYIVLNQAEALVAIDVNSGRATREHHIEDTALKTNMEAAEEIARQLRLRDLAGLVVIDFIDMDEKRNNRTVERRLKESLKHDRARIQVGHISHFGLLEMSRQRIRSSVLESTTEKCEHCGGLGHVRSVSSVALQLLRALDEMLQKGATHNVIVRTRTEIALYLLNLKRAHLRALEERFQIAIMVNADATIGAQVSYLLEKGELVHSAEQARVIAAQSVAPAPAADDDDVDAEQADEEIAEDGAEETYAESTPAEPAATELAPAEGDQSERAEGDEAERNGRRRRRRRRGRRGDEGRPDEGRDEEARESVAVASEQPADIAMVPGDGEPAEATAVAEGDSGQPNTDAQAESERRRRRGRRGGRRNRRGREGEEARPNGGFDADTQGAQAAHGGTEPGFAARDTEFAPAAESMAEPRQHAEAPEHHSDRQPWQSSPPPQSEPAPVAQLWQPPAPAAPQSEPSPEPATSPRRRSTVREAAPVSLGEMSPAAAPIPEPPPEAAPAAASAEPEEDARPRRSGWWSRRVFGKG